MCCACRKLTHSWDREPPLRADSQAQVQPGPSPGLCSYYSDHLQLCLPGYSGRTLDLTSPTKCITSLVLPPHETCFPSWPVPCCLADRAATILPAQVTAHRRQQRGGGRGSLSRFSLQRVRKCFEV